MRYKKIYGAPGLMECQFNIQMGKCHFTIHFKDGGISGYGESPAEFKTEDPIMQHIIENSDFFKNGKIILLRSIELDPPEEVPAKVIDAEGEESQEGESENAVMNVIPVDSIQDAKDYMVKNFGMKASNLKTLSAIQSAAAEQNIIFEIQE